MREDVKYDINIKLKSYKFELSKEKEEKKRELV